MTDVIPLDKVVAAPTKTPSTDFVPMDVVRSAVPTPTQNVPRPPGPDFRAMEAVHENALLGSSQFIQPDVAAHEKNLLGTAHVNDAGEVGWDDKGTFRLTSQKEHLILRDPKDGQYKIYKRSPELEEGPIMGRLSGLGQFVSQGYATSAPAQLSSGVKGGEVAAAAIRQGIDAPKFLANPSESVATRASVASKVPLSGYPIKQAAGEFNQQLAERTAQVAREGTSTGEAISAVEAGAKTRGGVQAWAESLFGKKGDDTVPGRITEAYRKVDSVVDPSASGPLTNTIKVAQELQEKYSKANLPESRVVKELLGPITEPGGLTYDTVKFVREKIGKEIANPGEISKGIGETELKRMYGALSDDMRNIIRSAGESKAAKEINRAELNKMYGPSADAIAKSYIKYGGDRAVQEWDRASKMAKAAHDRLRSLDKVIGSAAKSDEQIFAKVHQLAGTSASADAKTLATVKKTVGQEAWNDVRAGVVHKLGQVDTPAGKTFNPARWAQDYGKLSEQGKDLLFGSRGSTYRQALDDIARLSERSPTAAKIAGDKGGLSHTGILGAGGIVYALHDVINDIRAAMFGHGGGMALGATAATIMLGDRLYASAISKPATARDMARWMRTVEAYNQVPGANSLAMMNNATRTIANQLAVDGELKDPGEFAKYVTGAIRAYRAGKDGK